MGLIIGQVMGDLSCIGNLCKGINALGMWQPLDCVGGGCVLVKSTLCAVAISLLGLSAMDASHQLWKVSPSGHD